MSGNETSLTGDPFPDNPHDAHAISDRGIDSFNITVEKPAVTRPRYSTWLVSSGRHPRPRSSIRRSARAATIHMLHVISRPESQKTATMVMTVIVSISSSLRGDCRFPVSRSFHMHSVRYHYGGDCEGVRPCGDGFSFRFSNVVGRETCGLRKVWDAKERKERKKAGNRFGKPLYGFPSSCSGRPPGGCRMFELFGI